MDKNQVLSPNAEIRLGRPSVWLFSGCPKLTGALQDLGDKFDMHLGENTLESMLAVLKTQIIDIVILPDINNWRVQCQTILQQQAFDGEFIVTADRFNGQQMSSYWQQGFWPVDTQITDTSQWETILGQCHHKVRQRRFIRSTVESQNRNFDKCLNGESNPISALEEAIEALKEVRQDILILGEMGTEVDLVVEKLCIVSDPLIPKVIIDCRSVPTNFFEGILFGYEKGSFSAAVESNAGKLRLAHGGIAVLQRIDCLSESAMEGLTTFLASRRVASLGSGKPIKVDVQIIATLQWAYGGDGELPLTNWQGRFKGRTIVVPPLRNRLTDLENVIASILKSRHQDNGDCGVSQDLLNVLLSYHWPGNYDELFFLLRGMQIKNTHESLLNRDTLAQMSLNQEMVQINKQIQDNLDAEQKGNCAPATIQPNFTREEVCVVLEKVFIKSVLARVSSKQEAAALLGIERRSLYRRLQKLGLD